MLLRQFASTLMATIVATAALDMKATAPIALVHSLLLSYFCIKYRPLKLVSEYTLQTYTTPDSAVSYLKVHGHDQTHSRNFCRFKLDI